MDLASGRYPAVRWLTAVLVTTALVVAIRFGAALADVEVVVPDRAAGPPEPLGLGPLVVVTLGAFVVAIVAVVALDRLLPGRGRRVVRLVGLLLLAASFIPVLGSDQPGESRLVLSVLHLVVGIAVLRTVVRE
ncbi:DUF6069 family protein [Nitriliruptor alkaliphilus]|uniref:DUF6069 family protein n=1 Tax=Nitriliruptor alkaliphilus TaxID=427918 RepID=UPI00069623A6|nr:DUF6069 family protein [Nitriliruptor alkaliphilus]